MTAVEPATSGTGAKPIADTRRFWRVLLAVVLPLPWLAKGVQYIVRGASDVTAAQIQDWADNDVYAGLQWLDAVFVVLVVPSILGLAFLARRGAPRLAGAAAIVMGGGFLLVLPLNVSSDHLAWVAARNGYDADVIARFIGDVASDPRVGVGGLGFIVAILFGSVILGLALWRSRVVATWAAAAVGLGGVTHPFLSFEHHVHGAGLVVLALGCAAASAAVLRLRDEEFDLPPRRPQ